MRTVWKYTIDWEHATMGVFSVPAGGAVLAVDIDPRGMVAIWIEVDTNAEHEVRIFEMFPTGGEVPEAATAYLGTVMVSSLVLHVYERDASGQTTSVVAGIGSVHAVILHDESSDR